MTREKQIVKQKKKDVIVQTPDGTQIVVKAKKGKIYGDPIVVLDE